MIDWTALSYVFFCGATLMLAVLGLESAITTHGLDRWDKRFFTAFFGALVPASALFFLEMVAFVRPDLTVLIAIAYFFESLLSAIPFLMLSTYLPHCCGEDWRGSTLFRTTLVLFGVYVALLCITQFTPWFYIIVSFSESYIGPAYPLLIAPLIAMLIVLDVGVVKRRSQLPPQYFRAFLVCLVPLTLALIVHAITPAFPLVYVSLAVSVFTMYRLIENASVDRLLRQQKEIASQRASIAVLQMRPHFIYNTMTSIYYLCDQDPQMAKQVTLDFTTYLRKNFKGIASDQTIAFTEELEHARAYLAVEQAQFCDNLVVEYDTPHLLFRVPPLTLQPLVENAVKHGMNPDSAPLHVWVRTRKTDAGAEVVVADNGCGFDHAIADDPRTTLANIRQRLDMMCGATMSFEIREGGGTVVRLLIPERG